MIEQTKRSIKKAGFEGYKAYKDYEFGQPEQTRNHKSADDGNLNRNKRTESTIEAPTTRMRGDENDLDDKLLKKLYKQSVKIRNILLSDEIKIKHEFLQIVGIDYYDYMTQPHNYLKGIKESNAECISKISFLCFKTTIMN